MPVLLPPPRLYNPATTPNLTPHLLSTRHYGDRERRVLEPKSVGIIVAIFVLVICGPILCIRLVRNRQRRGRARVVQVLVGPRTLGERREDARRRLDGVTEVVVRVAGNDEKAHGVGKKERGWEDRAPVDERDCAICLSTLHIPLPPQPAKLKTRPLGIAIALPNPFSKREPVLNKEVDDKTDILRLKVCGHEFHAECLISWFVIRKYSCPICRAVYYGREAEERLSNEERREIGVRQLQWDDGRVRVVRLREDV